MSIITASADLVYTFRFLKLLTQPWEETAAYKAGIIDAKGQRVKTVGITNINKDAYTPFHRLVFNIKRLIPGNRFASYAAALYLLKEKYNVSDKSIEKVLRKVGIENDLVENYEWYMLDDKRISPGIYRLTESKILNSTFEPVCRKMDKIRISEKCYPIGTVLGIDIYEATHVRTKQQIYVAAQDLLK